MSFHLKFVEAKTSFYDIQNAGFIGHYSHMIKALTVATSFKNIKKFRLFLRKKIDTVLYKELCAYLCWTLVNLLCFLPGSRQPEAVF